MKLLSSEEISDVDKLRLACLYALRYENENPRQLESVIKRLSSKQSKFKPSVSAPPSLMQMWN